MSTSELQASALALKAEKNSLEALLSRRRKTVQMLERKAEAWRLRSVPLRLSDAVAVAKASVDTAEKNLAGMQWYVVKKYKYDSPVDGNDTCTADDADVTRYERDKGTVDWADECIRECKAIREEAMNCIGPEKVLLDIHARELEDQVVYKGCERKRAYAAEKLETYRKLERAVECAKESHRQAEAQVANFQAGHNEMCEHAAKARVYCKQREAVQRDLGPSSVRDGNANAAAAERGGGSPRG